MFSAANGDDLLDEFIGYDFTMGADVVKYPECGYGEMPGVREEVPEG